MKKEKNVTLLQAIGKIIESVENSKLDKKVLRKIKPYSSFLAKSYGITELQAIFFCICLEKGPRRVDLDDIARHLNLRSINMLLYAEDINALVRRRLLRYRDARDEEEFDVYTPVIKALKHNEVYEIPDTKGLDCAQLFEQLEILFSDLCDNTSSVPYTIESIVQLFEDNSNLHFVKEVRKLGRFWRRHLSACSGAHSCQNLQQCAFSRTVLTHKCNAVFIVNYK